MPKQRGQAQQEQRQAADTAPEAVEAAAATPEGANGASAAESVAETTCEDLLGLATARAADFEDRWKRSAAEFINYKRRTEQERGELLRFANRGLILELLPVLDDLERALAHVPPDQAESEWVKGTRLVERKFRQLLERQGLTPIEAVGQPFDPAQHEAVGGSGAVVAQEYQRGYKLHDKVLRPSMVLVGEGVAAGEPVATASSQAVGSR